MTRKNRSPEENVRREKIRELLQMANIDSIPSTISLVGGTGHDKGRGRSGRCLLQPPTLPNNLKGAITMSVDVMNEKVKELRELRRMWEDLATEIASIEEELKDHMDWCGMDMLLGMDWSITWKSVASSRLDTAALKKALPDVVERFTKTTTCRRFCVA